ncbi:MAG: hypothetical protein MUC77_04345 [Chromatiaceae bacterium]|nr:hypothetical protein [Chromatiaceae bacterium]
MSGMFAGMDYAAESHGSLFLPKILGTYEKELTNHLDRLQEEAIEAIVVVGAAEGYYAVGFALRWKTACIVAFEPNPAARTCLAAMAHKNGVANRLQVQGICDVPSLRSALNMAVRPFVLVDIEGGEAILLDPTVVEELGKATVVVELHEFAVPGVGALIRSRFEGSHEIEEVFAVPRTPHDFPLDLGRLKGSVSAGAAVQIMSEGRPPNMSWLVIRPKAST